MFNWLPTAHRPRTNNGALLVVPPTIDEYERALGRAGYEVVGTDTRSCTLTIKDVDADVTVGVAPSDDCDAVVVFTANSGVTLRAAASSDARTHQLVRVLQNSNPGLALRVDADGAVHASMSVLMPDPTVHGGHGLDNLFVRFVQAIVITRIALKDLLKHTRRSAA